MKIVLDSNVVIAAFAARGLCHALFEYCLENHDVIICEEILDEVEAALLSKVKVPEEVAAEVIGYLRASSESVRPVAVDVADLEDTSDLPILGAAVSSRADYLVTGDRELVKLVKISGTGIVTPRAFWEKMKRG
jgi:putative PIN family toxin of toxin-antitoxin system